MNVYDAIIRDYPVSTFRFVTQAQTYPNLMGGSLTFTTAPKVITNMLLDPAATTVWPTNSAAFATNSLDTTIKRTGTSSVKGVSANGTILISAYNAGGLVQTGVTVGAAYSGRMYARPSIANTQGRVSIHFLTSAGAGITGGSFYGAFAPLTSGAWTEMTLLNVVAPPTAAWIRMMVEVNMISGTAVVGTDYVNVDDGMLVQGTTLPPQFDGSSTNTPGVTYAWTGPVNNSSSTKTEIANLYSGSMVSGPGNSLMLGDGWYGYIDATGRFNDSWDGLPFSVEMWIKLTDTTPARLTSHTNSFDGIYFDGDNIEFSVDLASGASPSVKWPVPDFTKDYYVVGTYSGSKVSLYIDGALIGSAEVPDGDKLQNKTTNLLFVGIGAGPVLVEAPALHFKELSATQVMQHYLAGRQNIPTSDIVGANGGKLFTFTDAQRDVLFKDYVDWDTEGVATSVVVGDYLVPSYDQSDLSVAGNYVYLVNAGDPTLTGTYQGMKMEWNGDGNYTVEYSINSGSTWSTAVNGAVQTGTQGLSSQVPPMIRISFPAGRAKGLDVVRDMLITVYSSFTIYGVNDTERKFIMTVSNTPTTSSKWSEPIELDDASGLYVKGAGSAVLQESTEATPTNIGSIGMWVKMNTVQSGYIFDARSVTPSNPAYLWASGTSVLGWPAGTISAVYVNGVAIANNTFAPVAGRWYHIIMVWATPFNSKINFNNTGSNWSNNINMISLYEQQLTAAQVATIYGLYNRAPALAVEDTNMITVSETAPAAKAYVNDWSITGAG